MERLQKVIANSNIASRRKAEELIKNGLVKVNGVVVTELGTKVNKNDEIIVDGKKVEIQEKTYLLLNKPTGYLSTTSDDKKRRTVLDLVKEDYPGVRMYPVGRLDYDSAGLLLLTNDGDLTLKLTKPEFLVEKEYIVRVKGVMLKKTIQDLKKGVKIDNDYLAIAKEAAILSVDKENQSTLVGMIITEGKNRQIRKMMDKLGYPVKNLTRVKYDFLTLDGVKRGGYRELTNHEVKKLHANQVKR
ncbi:MAG: pseudouridine synthase [Acholeplasma sp.]|nr:pseudouridine synthase [Acholeplasma sp.]